MSVPVDGADAGHSVTVTHSLGQKPVSDLPGKHGGVLPLVLGYLLNYFRSGYLGLGPADDPWFDAASLVVPAWEKGSDMQLDKAGGVMVKCVCLRERQNIIFSFK